MGVRYGESHPRVRPSPRFFARMAPTRIDHVLTISGDRLWLDRIARPQTALAIWWRGVPEPLRSLLAKLDLATVEDLSVTVEAGHSLEAALRGAGYPQTVLAPLAEDIDLLVRRHAALTGEDRLQVGLGVVGAGSDTCFGTDCGTLRLSCTYVGAGEQWCCADGRDAIWEVPTGAVAIWKGRDLLDPPLIVRRAPPISANAGRRLVLAIDPPSC